VSRRVFLIYTHPLFFEAVRLMLQRSDVTLVGQTTSPAQIRDALQQLHPDIILVEEKEDGFSQSIAEVLAAGPGRVRIVGLNLSNNRLNIYDRKQQVVGQLEDLITLLLNDL